MSSKTISNPNLSGMIDQNGKPTDDVSFFGDLSFEELVRGTTPKDIDKRCLALCQEYICGTWKAATETDIELKRIDRKSTRLNSSHVAISYAVFCLKKKTFEEHVVFTDQ